LLMEVDSEESLKQKLNALIKDEALRIRMGENGYRKVKENYTWDIIVARLRSCYLNGLGA
jgi:glycosyltransferase involved in cell wall biosynthesis